MPVAVLLDLAQAPVLFSSVRCPEPVATIVTDPRSALGLAEFCSLRSSGADRDLLVQGRLSAIQLALCARSHCPAAARLGRAKRAAAVWLGRQGGSNCPALVTLSGFFFGRRCLFSLEPKNPSRLPAFLLFRSLSPD
jgi:hypothetical protein